MLYLVVCEVDNMNLLIMDLHISLSIVASAYAFPSLRCVSIGVLAGFYAVLPVSLRRSITFFC